MDEITKKICEVFDHMFPNAYCELKHHNHFELLVAVILSAQTTDKSVNQVTEILFQRFKTPEDFVKADIKEIEDGIRRLGLYKNKAKNIKKMSMMLIDKYDGKVPSTRDALMKLPGVGRKTANVILSVAFNQSAFAVDTHVERVSKRLAIAKNKDTVLTVEKKLNEFFPPSLWNKLHHQMIFFGRYHCLARNPKCKNCQLQAICQYYKDNKNK